MPLKLMAKVLSTSGQRSVDFKAAPNHAQQLQWCEVAVCEHDTCENFLSHHFSDSILVCGELCLCCKHTHKRKTKRNCKSLE